MPQTFNYFGKIQERIVQFITENSRIKKEKLIEFMLRTGELAADVGSVIYGEEAVETGLIDQLGGLSDVLEYLHSEINRRRNAQD